MNCLLIYYTGTFNTRYLSKLLKDKFSSQGIDVTLYEINPLKTETLDLSRYDMIGLGYPIYGFAVTYPFLKFIRRQKFQAGQKVFIYKNSGETYSANDASSLKILRVLRRQHVTVNNEYHFMMPYNIHFRYDEYLVKEMLLMDEKLEDILVYEVLNDIPNIKKYKFINKFIALSVGFFFAKDFAGNVNSFFYRVDRKKCVNCNLCINQCPVKNIYRNKKNKIKFHHHCLMCMRCSLCCPKDAIHIGYLQGWKVNGPYDFNKINAIEHDHLYITDQTKGFFKCYIRKYKEIDERYHQLFSEE